MNQASEFHILTVGWEHSFVENLWDRIEEKSESRFSHILHPKVTDDDLLDKLD